MIVEIIKKSPADKIDLKPGDVILSVNNKDVNRPTDIREIILENDFRAGDIITLRVFRDGNYKNKKMKLDKFKIK